MLSCTFRLRPISSISTIDPLATDETKALFMKLWTLADANRTLFGHQDDLFFGIGWRMALFSGGAGATRTKRITLPCGVSR